MQQAINPESEEKNERKYIDSVFREGDRIMQIKNNYDIYWEKREPALEMGKGVFNGEYGTILNIDEVEKKVKIKFDDDKLVWYNFDELEQIEHSYCITVHKAQRKRVRCSYYANSTGCTNATYSYIIIYCNDKSKKTTYFNRKS